MFFFDLNFQPYRFKPLTKLIFIQTGDSNTHTQWLSWFMHLYSIYIDITACSIYDHVLCPIRSDAFLFINTYTSYIWQCVMMLPAHALAGNDFFNFPRLHLTRCNFMQRWLCRYAIFIYFFIKFSKPSCHCAACWVFCTSGKSTSGIYLVMQLWLFYKMIMNVFFKCLRHRWLVNILIITQ